MQQQKWNDSNPLNFATVCLIGVLLCLVSPTINLTHQTFWHGIIPNMATYQSIDECKERGINFM